MTRHPGIRQRLTLGVIAYTVILSMAVAAHGYIVNEGAEALIWETLLESELNHFEERLARDPSYHWTDTENLKLFGGPTGQKPLPEFAALSPGVHDEIETPQGQFVILVRGAGARRAILALNISDMERREHRLIWTIVISSAVIVVVLAFVTFLGVGWLVKPLNAISTAIASLSPDRGEHRIPVAKNAPQEAVVIAKTLNDYLGRMDRFVERERGFINMASHELRTPIAVLRSSAEVALDQIAAAKSPEFQLQRILRTTRDMQHLVSLLLALAKDPARLRSTMETVDLADLVPPIIEDHLGLATPKELSIHVDSLPPNSIRVVRQLAQAAIANLLRNAIENSARGVIRISATGAAIVITDPGHGMSEEELSRIHTRLARTGSTAGSGIGIELIARLCEHLDWRLTFSSEPGRGTVATLAFA